eukprot:2149820-Pleurochrysis_carterae.AAC.2
MPLVGGGDVNGTASGDPTDLRFNRPYEGESDRPKLVSAPVTRMGEHTDIQINDILTLWFMLGVVTGISAHL